MTSQDEGRNSFVRGMTVGAIIGAIVAGSSLWSRRRRARRAAQEAELEAVAVADQRVVEALQELFGAGRYVGHRLRWRLCERRPRAWRRLLPERGKDGIVAE